MPVRNIYIYAGHQVPHGYVVPMEEEEEEEEEEDEEEKGEEEKHIVVTTSIFKNSFQFDFLCGRCNRTS